MKVQLTAQTQPMVANQVLTVDEYIVWCARVSSPNNRNNHSTGSKLMNYLMDNKHWSPFEMVSFAFEIETSRAIAQQILRHRSFSFQEFSQRYAQVTAMEPIQLRDKTEKNRQSSKQVVERKAMIDAANDVVDHAVAMYNMLLREGVATETARFILPLCTQTTLVMHGTLRSWIHFLEQRCDEHAQKEIREIAWRIREQLAVQVPQVAEALGWEGWSEAND